MATISEKANLSHRYTNQNIRRTSGNAMKKGGATAQVIAHQLKQKNIQSMMHYLDLPTLEEKQENQELLFKYTHKKLSLLKPLHQLPHHPFQMTSH